MNRLFLTTALVVAASAASAQTKPNTPVPTNQAVEAGAAGVAARMQAQGFSEIHNLRKKPDGTWTGEATRNGVAATITAEPDGRLTAR